MQVFDDDRFYLTTDPELKLVGSRGALAQRRHRGEGPRYLRVGKRVLYRGRDLNEFLASCVVEPTSGSGRRDRSESPGDAAGRPPQSLEAAGASFSSSGSASSPAACA